MASELILAPSRAARLKSLPGRVRALRLPWIPLIIMIILLICAVFSELLSPHNPREIDILDARVAPFEGWTYPLGTDVLGRDMLSRLIFGARTAVVISLVALGAGGIVGTFLGLIAGYKGGWIDVIVMRLADAALGFPTILVAMLIVVLFGGGIWNIILAVMITVWARFARMIRGDVLSIKGLDFITFARVAGLPAWVIIGRHIFPNTINTLMVITSLLVGQVILLEAALSFLGLGLPVGDPAWGIMVSEGRIVIVKVWWLSLFPGLAITIVVLALNFFGDWLRDRLDPKLSRI
ncbi:MAG: ABC transporter permease [Dehalococcoidia bacterium]|nr:ABC transporter permease [Dehalococcoidia bacterium]MDP7083117.1 ABC transporter permease [Dehalococcoidia bacterium]MDP7200532.1 ABC transporter permease [Dehalococcoidia bacterium]MDP7509639.1 ABC transporter permease [Dehalococcoidia bacterium]HJN88515.1 ABC transporter permease [Dehalococcoidia bacterium]